MKQSNFWPKVRKTEGCWNWTAARAGKYGKFGRKYAHRYSYEIHKGEIPDGHDVRHTCHNPLCVNPDHLLTGTRAQNEQDKILAGRKHSQKGELHSRHKLTEPEVLEIRARREAGAKYAELSEDFGVSLSQIQKIINRSNWSHI